MADTTLRAPKRRSWSGSIDITKFDFSKGQPEMALKVEKEIFILSGDVTDKVDKAQSFVFGMNKR